MVKKTAAEPVNRIAEVPHTNGNGRTEKIITLSNINMEAMGEITVEIEGTSPLIMNQFSNKMRDEILKKQMGVGVKSKPAPKNPELLMLDALHVIGKKPKSIEDLSKTRFGFPAVAFKSAMVRMAKLSGVPMTDARLMFWIEGSKDDPELVEIFAEAPEMRTDVARIQNTCDIRIRPQFNKWRATLTLGYSAIQVSAVQVLGWLQEAGTLNGIGEMRPGGRQSSNVFGKWRIVDGTARALVPDIDKLKAGK